MRFTVSGLIDYPGSLLRKPLPLVKPVCTVVVGADNIQGPSAASGPGTGVYDFMVVAVAGKTSVFP